jgi:HD-GYP domain-containing protein (c-di-GMP phosphodiesterase class II)
MTDASDNFPSVGEGIDATANQATRARRQELGLKAALALHVLMRHARSYDERNAVFGPPLQQLTSAIDGLLATDGAFELRFAADEVRANRQSVRVDATTRPLLAAVYKELESKGARGISAAAQPPEADLRLLVALLRTGRRAPFAALKLIPLRADVVEVAAVPLEDRLTRAYAAAAFFAARTITQLRAGAEVAPAWAAARPVRDLVDLERLAPLSFLQLATTKAEGDEYWGHHAANVAVLAIAFGARLGLPKRRRHDLGMAAVFHDVGMAAMPATMLSKPTSLDEREKWTVAANPLFAARVMLRDREVHPAALERALAAYECHLDLDAPQAGEHHEIGFCGRVIAICEAFDAMTTARPHRAAIEPHAAISTMRGALAYRFDHRLIQLFTTVVRPILAAAQGGESASSAR